MNPKTPKCILLDIEGTTSSISFVYDVMFPYVRENLSHFLDANWGQADVEGCIPLLAKDVGLSSSEELVGPDLGAESAKNKVAETVISLMDDDVKGTGLKKLQGQIWKSGFESGKLVAHLFADVAPAIEQWRGQNLQIRIYSSGSVQAQKLFFGHTIVGNLLPQFSAHYDTTIGSKKDCTSYQSIASDAELDASQILFISDVAEELDAAAKAGMQTRLSIRPGNKPVPNPERYQSITDFRKLDFVEETA
ncbi:MAG: acireductone synthase [Planctomycetota bacterium]